MGKHASKRLAMNSEEDALATGGTGIKVNVLCVYACTFLLAANVRVYKRYTRDFTKDHCM